VKGIGGSTSNSIKELVSNATLNYGTNRLLFSVLSALISLVHMNRKLFTLVDTSFWLLSQLFDLCYRFVNFGSKSCHSQLTKI
jgi:hypothetical protein